MNKLFSSRLVLALSTAAALLLSSCASAGGRRPATPQPPSDGFVNREMGATISSVERSLQVLVELDRGDEGPRKNNALGMTVAGADGPDKPPVRMPNVAGPETDMGRAQAAEQRELSRQALGLRIRLNWTGEADGLLRELSRRIGFEYAVNGTGKTPVVRVDHKETTVEQVLREVADQIETVADVRVDTAKRRVTLDFKSAPSR